MLDGTKASSTMHTATHQNDDYDAAIPNIACLLLKYGASQECYHELSMCIPDLPRSHKVAR